MKNLIKVLTIVLVFIFASCNNEENKIDTTQQETVQNVVEEPNEIRQSYDIFGKVDQVIFETGNKTRPSDVGIDFDFHFMWSGKLDSHGLPRNTAWAMVDGVGEIANIHWVKLFREDENGTTVYLIKDVDGTVHMKLTEIREGHYIIDLQKQ